MNNEDFNKKNEIFIRELTNKGSFMINWFEGSILPIDHPKYYDGRIEVIIRKEFNNSYGKISFGRNEYQISDEIVNKLYNYVENNIEKLFKISLNQNTTMYEGGNESLSIKYNSIYITISRTNASSESEKDEIESIKNDIKNILIQKVNSQENELTHEEDIERIIYNLIGANDLDRNSLLINLAKRIVDLPFNNETTIAQLMKLDNNSVAIVDPLIQGEIFNLLMKVCE